MQHGERLRTARASAGKRGGERWPACALLGEETMGDGKEAPAGERAAAEPLCLAAARAVLQGGGRGGALARGRAPVRRRLWKKTGRAPVWCPCVRVFALMGLCGLLGLG